MIHIPPPSLRVFQLLVLLWLVYLITSTQPLDQLINLLFLNLAYVGGNVSNNGLATRDGPRMLRTFILAIPCIFSERIRNYCEK